MRSRLFPLIGLTLVASFFLLQLMSASMVRAQAAPHEAGTPSAATERAGVEGRVVRNGKPLAGLRVHAFLDAAESFRGDGYASSDPTTEKGLFTLVLPPGRYYLVAKGSIASSSPASPVPGEYFGYYGSNPVTVFPGVMTTRNIPAAPRTTPVVTSDTRSDTMMPLKGVVLSPQGPVAGATVHVYTDTSQQFRGPDLFGPQGALASGTDAQGTFTIELPAGTFYLVASKRKGGASLGQLQVGDLHGVYDSNPLQIVAGTSTSVVIQVEEKLKEQALTAVAAGITGIRGTIRDPSGAVPPRVFVFVGTDPSLILGSMPTRRSRFLGQDGSYFAEVPEGGTYYVFARSGYGGPPETGDWHGFYGEGSTPRPVVVQTGTIAQGVDFVVKKVR